MTDTITLQRYVVEKALEALKIGHESAHDCAETFHIEMAGYKQQRHEALDAEVKQISDAIGALRAALEQPQVDQPTMTHIAQRKLDDLLTRGYEISGYSVYHEKKHPHGFVTGAGLVGWWKPDGAEYPQPQGEQEPVAYYVMNGAALFQLFRSKSQADALAYDLQKRHDLSGSPAHFHVVPLYTHPQPKREPLTDAQINDHRLALPYDGEDLPDPWDFKQGVRAAERAHGIGGKV